MKTRKLMVISTLGLVLLAVFIATWWFLGDDAWVKGKVEDTVSEMTGRSLSIDGRFELDWSLNPVLKAEDIHFANPSWAVNQDLAKLTSLEASVDLFSVLKDKIKLHYIDIEGLVVALEERESGEKSWEIAPGQKGPDSESVDPETELPVSIDRLKLADFSLLHEAPDWTVPFDIHFAQLELTQKADQQIQIAADGQIGGEKFEFTADIGHGSGAYQIQSLLLESAGTSISVSGRVGDWPGLVDTELSFEVQAPSLESVGKRFDLPLPDEPLGASMKLLGTPKAFKAENLAITLGPSEMSGDISVNLEGKPQINGVLESNYLDLAWLQKSDEEKDSDEPAVESDQQTYLIPERPITSPRINFANSDIEISLSKVALLQQTFHDIRIHSRITDGNLYMDPIQLRGEHGGLLSGNLAVEQESGNDATSIALSLSGDDVQLGIRTVEGQDPDTIRSADISIDLSGAGATYRDFARSLDGRIEIAQGPGLSGNKGLNLIFGNFIGELFNLLNPFVEEEKFTVNECAVAIMNIESGMVTVEPVVSQTDKMTLVAKGKVDLHTEDLLLTFNTKLRKGTGISASMVINPFVSVTGTLLKPVVGLDPSAVVVKGSVAVATVGISLLAKSLADRFFSSKDPCGDALKKSREQLESAGKMQKPDQ